jgi:hypothetical protein
MFAIRVFFLAGLLISAAAITVIQLFVAMTVHLILGGALGFIIVFAFIAGLRLGRD